MRHISAVVGVLDWDSRDDLSGFLGGDLGRRRGVLGSCFLIPIALIILAFSDGRTHNIYSKFLNF